MSNTIWKFPIEIERDQTIQVPETRKFLHVGLDPSNEPCMWFIVDPNSYAVEFPVYVIGTGHPVPGDPLRFLGTFNQGPFIWHIFTELTMVDLIP